MNPCPDVIHLWWQWHPSIGTSAVLLCGVGIAIPLIKEKWDKREKVLWSIMMSLLVGLELWSIHWSDEWSKEEQQRAFCIQESKFEEVSAKAQRAADAAKDGIEQMKKLMVSAQHIDATTEQALNQETGNHQFCYLFTGIARGRDKEGKLLREVLVQNRGPLPLDLCHITIRESTFNDARKEVEYVDIMDKQLGPLAPGYGPLHGEPVNFAKRTDVILPEGTYVIEIETRNDRFSEFLHFDPSGPPEMFQVKDSNGKVIYTDLLSKERGIKFPPW